VKYLKKYNEAKYYLTDNVIDDVNDILLDLVDDGFKTDIRTEVKTLSNDINFSNFNVYCSFVIRLNKPNFNFSDIKETLLRLKSYSNDANFNFNLYGNHEPIVVNNFRSNFDYTNLERWDKYMARIFFKVKLDSSDVF
jgi:hypothetical protein